MVWGDGGTNLDVAELLRKAKQTGSLCIMPFRKFGSVECIQLCTLLCAEPGVITELLASGHAIGGAGARAVASALAKPGCSITKLCIGDSQFGTEGVAAIESGKTRLCSLEEWDLEYKGLCPDAARSLGALIGRNALPALQVLKLARNPLLGDVAIDELLAHAGDLNTSRGA